MVINDSAVRGSRASAMSNSAPTAAAAVVSTTTNTDDSGEHCLRAYEPSPPRTPYCFLADNAYTCSISFCLSMILGGQLICYPLVLSSMCLSTPRSRPLHCAC